MTHELRVLLSDFRDAYMLGGIHERNRALRALDDYEHMLLHTIEVQTRRAMQATINEVRRDQEDALTPLPTNPRQAQ